MRLIVNSIGDADCISIISGDKLPCSPESYDYCDHVGGSLYETFACHTMGCLTRKGSLGKSANSCFDLVIDFGHFNQRIYYGQVAKTESFLLTHFHTDHYRGFTARRGNACRQPGTLGNLKRFYYQKLPYVDGSAENTETLCFLMCLYNIVSQDIQSCCDFFRLFGKNTSFIAVGKGDSIRSGNGNYEVIWPANHISYPKLKDVVDSIYKIDSAFIDAMMDIHSACLKKLNGHSDANTGHSDISVFETCKRMVEDMTNGHKVASILLGTNNPKRRAIKKAVSSVANSISVCLYKEKEFLSLGDLEGKDIKNCLSGLLKEKRIDKIDVRYFVTAHHGTHWDEECENIEADFVVSSNGSKMISGFEKGYFKSAREANSDKECSRRSVHNTIALAIS